MAKQKLPKEFYVHRYALLNGSVCSHVHRDNVFVPGERAYLAEQADKDFAYGVLIAMAFGMLYTVLLLKAIGKI